MMRDRGRLELACCHVTLAKDQAVFKRDRGRAERAVARGRRAWRSGKGECMPQQREVIPFAATGPRAPGRTLKRCPTPNDPPTPPDIPEPRAESDEDTSGMVDVAYELLGDDPEPEDGWRAFDVQGRRFPRKAAATSTEPMEPASVDERGHFGWPDVVAILSNRTDVLAATSPAFVKEWSGPDYVTWQESHMRRFEVARVLKNSPDVWTSSPSNRCGAIGSSCGP